MSKRFDWLKHSNPRGRTLLYKAFLSYPTEEIDQKLLSVLLKNLATDTEVLEKSDHSLDSIIFNLLQKCVADADLKKCDIFATYLETSENEIYKKYAGWVRDNFLHKENPEEVVEILNQTEDETSQTTDEEKTDDELSVEEFEKTVVSRDAIKIRELFESGQHVPAKAFVHRMKSNPSKYNTYNIEYLRLKRDLAWKNSLEFKSSKPRAAEELEKKAQEYERLALETTRLLATQKEPLEEELLPLIMKHAILEPEDKDLAQNFALRYLKEPTCFRSIEKEAICVMLVRLYKNQGEYDKIVSLLDTLMSGLNDSNRTSTLNPYERELLRNLGEAYLMQSNGKLSQGDLQKLTTFVNNFSNPNDPKHGAFLNNLITDLKNREAEISIDIVDFSIIPQTTPDYSGGERPYPPDPNPDPDVYGKYSSELSLEKRIEYIAQKERSLGFDVQGKMSLDEETFTGYMLIRGVSPDGERAEPFYHAEKLFDITKMPLAKRSEALKKLKEFKENNPNVDLYTFRDVAVNQIGIPEAYGAASYLIKADENAFSITSELGDFASASKLIGEFEEASKIALTMPVEERTEFLKDYMVLTYNHTTGKNESNPAWYDRTNRAYDAFRSVTAAASGCEYQKKQAEKDFEYNSRNSRIRAYVSTPNMDPTLVKIYLLINEYENVKYNYMKMQEELAELESELQLVPTIEVEGVAEADVLLQRLAKVFKRKYGKDIFVEAGVNVTADDKDKDEFLKDPKTEKEHKTKSDILGTYDLRYKEHKKSYAKSVTDDDVIPKLEEKDNVDPNSNNQDDEKAKMIELLKEYREFSYRLSIEYRRKILAYADKKILMKKSKEYQKNLAKEINELRKGESKVDPVTGEIIRADGAKKPSVLPTFAVFEEPYDKTGTDR